MTYEEKLNALLASANAYLARGKYLQYDQLSMDRTVRITPRRRYILPPESATSQQRLYLDCATFVCAVFNNAFGYDMEADVTWNIRELAHDCVYYFNKRDDMTDEDYDKEAERFKKALRPGDAVVTSRATNGHIMLYIDEDHYIHSTSSACPPGSYDYKNRRDNLGKDSGTVRIDNPSHWYVPNSSDGSINRTIFHRNSTIIKAAIIRPLNHVGDPTPDTIARMTTARDLFCEVCVSHPGGRTAYKGDTLTYTVNVRSDRDTDTEADISISVIDGCTPLSKRLEAKLSIPAGASVSVPFEYRVDECRDVSIAPPRIVVNGLNVYAPPILYGNNLTESEADTVVSEYKAALKGGSFASMAAHKAYKAVGIDFPHDRYHLIRSLFFRHDSLNGEVYSRRTQQPSHDMAVYSYFGGISVITPECASDIYKRTIQLRMTDLQKGDIILCCDDHTARDSYMCMYDGSGFAGNFERNEATGELYGDDAARWLDTLMGRYMFVILRPAQKK